jgi:DNA repair protein RecN (Recombination protein N)
LVQANFTDGEQEKLESEAKILEHAEEIKTKLQAAVAVASGAEYSTQQSVKEIKTQLQSIAAYATDYQKLLERVMSVSIELNDLVQEMEQENERVTFDPERAAWVTDRLNLLNRLLTKHRLNSVAELNVLQEQLRQKATLSANLDDELSRTKTELAQATEQLNQTAAQLTAARKKAGKPLCAEVIRLLQELGIPEAILTLQHDPATPGPTGADRIELLFSANKGVAPRPLAQVASGGEFSRVMFCMKYVMAAKTHMPTLILDEIDTGVSGEIAIKLGKLMNKMASQHQVLAITHLPQIAARGTAHYVVFKDNRSAKTVSGIKLLNDTERVEAIARMIGGDNPSRVAVANAKEMLVG